MTAHLYTSLLGPRDREVDLLTPLAIVMDPAADENSIAVYPAWCPRLQANRVGQRVESVPTVATCVVGAKSYRPSVLVYP